MTAGSHARHDRPHTHSHDEDWVGDDAGHPLWDADHITLTSVGIDVGSATAQVLFSRLELHREGRNLSSRYAVVSREILYRSPVHLTPYAAGLRIDERRLRGLVQAAFTEAGLRPDDVDTGAIILTGEATRRKNARAIADIFATESGDFVCATAGHHMEATLAAYGSGAVALSRESGRRVLNVDIGGGTTKFAVVDRGEVVHTAAMHIGGRLVVVDDDSRIIQLEPAGRRISAMTGVAWCMGECVTDAQMQRVCEWMADAILAVAEGSPARREVVDLMLTDVLPGGASYEAVLFSGGVSEYVYGAEQRSYGDLGALLGQAVARRARGLPGPLERACGGIRATVLGASQYTVQVSGNTIYVSDRAVLPLQNLQVVYPKIELSDAVDALEVAEAITGHLAKLEVDITDEIAFAFRWDGRPAFSRLDSFVRGVEHALAPRLAAGHTICLLFEGDVGRTVGALLKEDHGHRNAVISIDGVAVTDFEFIDVGSVLEKSGTVPVSIKSLVFHL